MCMLWRLLLWSGGYTWAYLPIRHAGTPKPRPSKHLYHPAPTIECGLNRLPHSGDRMVGERQPSRTGRRQLAECHGLLVIEPTVSPGRVTRDGVKVGRPGMPWQAMPQWQQAVSDGVESSAPWGWPSRGGAVLYRLSPQLGEDPPCWGPGVMWSSGGTGVAQLVARSTPYQCVVG